jgi:hypothetical protein
MPVSKPEKFKLGHYQKRGPQKQTERWSRRDFLHRCGSGNSVTQGGWSVSVVFPTGQLRSAIVWRPRRGAMRVRALVRLTGTLLSKMGSGNRLTWAAVCAYATGYRL